MSDHVTTRFVEALFSVDSSTHENLRTPQGIKDELTSWLEGLGATVFAVTVATDASHGAHASTHKEEE